MKLSENIKYLFRITAFIGGIVLANVIVHYAIMSMKLY